MQNFENYPELKSLQKDVIQLTDVLFEDSTEEDEDQVPEIPEYEA